jgi:hypothetical protein
VIQIHLSLISVRQGKKIHLKSSKKKREGDLEKKKKKNGRNAKPIWRRKKRRTEKVIRKGKDNQSFYIVQLFLLFSAVTL